MESSKAGERRLLSYAMDLALEIDAKPETVPSRLTSVRISRRDGAVDGRSAFRKSRTRPENEDAEHGRWFIEHPVRAGWELGGTVKPTKARRPGTLPRDDRAKKRR
jgi:hypothetical protein